jgi:cyclic pyranopterin phosphate synthase
MLMRVNDTLDRPLRDLRISVTDRCNYRCLYCMPLLKYRWVKHEEVLTFEEVVRLTAVFIGLGVRKVRLTGGEPLLRADVERLVKMLAGLDGLEDLSMTTNGSLLADKIDELRAAGLDRLNVSLDTLDPDTFRTITQQGDLEKVLEGLEAARAAGLAPIKLNTVVERGVNDDQIVDIVEFARREGYELRFIEYMDVGNANRWTLDKLVPRQEILARVSERYPLRPVDGARGSAPAQEYEFEDGSGRVGIVASVTEPFCGDCTRARLTAEGVLVTCLFAEGGTDLKGAMRDGADDEILARQIESVWKQRADRFSEERLDALVSGDGYDPGDRSKIEMIRLGG